MKTTTKPIPLEVIQKVKVLLADKPRELAWFQLSLNSAFRGGDILKIKLSDLQFIAGRLEIELLESKTSSIRRVPINEETTRIVQNWLALHPKTSEYLFCGQRGKMNTPFWSQQLKSWTKAVGWDEPRVATHSMRKSFVRINHEKFKVPMYVLSHALGHSTELQTRIYCGLLAEGVAEAYSNVI